MSFCQKKLFPVKGKNSCHRKLIKLTGNDFQLRVMCKCKIYEIAISGGSGIIKCNELE
jgi:hypothetical protein